MGANLKVVKLHKTMHEDEVSRVSRNFFKDYDVEGVFNSCDHGTYYTGGSVPAHSHDDVHEIFYFIRGTGLFILDGKEIPVKPGSVINVPPKSVHEIRNTGVDLLQHLVCSVIVDE